MGTTDWQPEESTEAASIIGFGTLFKLATRQLTLDEAVSRVCQRIGINGRAIVWPYAEPCMDVDKPHQLELLRADLERQQQQLMKKEKAKAKRAKPTTTGKAKAKTVKSELKPNAKLRR